MCEREADASMYERDSDPSMYESNDSGALSRLDPIVLDLAPRYTYGPSASKTVISEIN